MYYQIHIWLWEESKDGTPNWGSQTKYVIIARAIVTTQYEKCMQEESVDDGDIDKLLNPLDNTSTAKGED